MFINKKAFTLAEVLITLGIIGVVAALTIPTLINNYQTKATITNLKKAHSEFSQAYLLAIQENGTPDTWGLTEGDAQGAVTLINKIIPYLKTSRQCIGTAESDYKGCFPDVTYKYLNNNPWINLNSTATSQKAILSDGALVSVEVNSATCNPTYGITNNSNKSPCGDVTIDINGFKQPNQVGKDTFIFWITKSGIIPVGTKDDSNSNQITTSGFGDAAWVLYNENMDYLKCNVGWSGPTTCP